MIPSGPNNGPKYQIWMARAPKKFQVEKINYLLLGDACFNFISLTVLRVNPDSKSQSERTPNNSWCFYSPENRETNSRRPTPLATQIGIYVKKLSTSIEFNMGITSAPIYQRTSNLTMNNFSKRAVLCFHDIPTKNEG